MASGTAVKNTASAATASQGLQTSATEGETEPVLTVTVPMKRTNGYAATRIDLTLNPEQAQKLRDVFNGLNAKHAVLKNGRHVDTAREALLYLLENLK